jgi:hypothetical protein
LKTRDGLQETLGSSPVIHQKRSSIPTLVNQAGLGMHLDPLIPESPVERIEGRAAACPYKAGCIHEELPTVQDDHAQDMLPGSGTKGCRLTVGSFLHPIPQRGQGPLSLFRHDLPLGFLKALQGFLRSLSQGFFCLLGHLQRRF